MFYKIILKSKFRIINDIFFRIFKKYFIYKYFIIFLHLFIQIKFYLFTKNQHKFIFSFNNCARINLINKINKFSLYNI